MPSLNTIIFEKYKIIVIIDNNGTIWFNAKQICISLGYRQTEKAISNNVDNEDKIKLKNMEITFEINQQPGSIYINESGLYSLLISSKTKRSKKLIKWITNVVLPSFRKQKIDTTDEEINKLLKKINELEIKNKLLENDIKLEQFPNGAIVYVIEDYDVDLEVYYRIGKTDDMNKRIKIYNTHSIHNKKVVHYIDVQCPLQFETCIRSMLYKYRHKNKKDYYKCSLNKILKAFGQCSNSINCVETLDGGGNLIMRYEVTYYKDKLNELYDTINISSIE
jgi:prophage antirepressor-like protein